MPANEIVGLLPGELFVHRNVANVVVHTDLNCLSVMQYAVDVLRWSTSSSAATTAAAACGRAARRPLGLDRQLAAPRAGRARRSTRAGSTASRRRGARIDRLCELNVIEQVVNVCQTTIVAATRGSAARTLAVHGWIYGLSDGLLRDLGVCVTSDSDLWASYEAARTAVSG